MVDADELRIGNYFHPSNKLSDQPREKMSALDKLRNQRVPSTAIYHRVGAINKFGEIEVIEPTIPNTLSYMSSEIFGVAMSKDLIEKCGWKSSKFVESVTITHDQYVSEMHPTLIIRIESGLTAYMYNRINNSFFYLRKISFLHEFQNLVFITMGEELKIKL